MDLTVDACGCVQTMYGVPRDMLGRESVLSMPEHGFEPDSTMQFRSVPTIWILLLQLAVQIALVVVLFVGVPTDFFPVDEDTDFLFGVMLHVFVFLLVVLVDRYVHYYHRRARFLGHLSFYRSTRSLRKIPFTTLALGNAAILLLVSLWDADEGYAGVYRINVLQGITTLEIIICGPALLLLIVKTWRFNSRAPLPDSPADLLPSFDSAVNSGGASLRTLPQHRSSHAGGGIGFSEEDYLDEVMERQGDMIKYLQQQKETLSLNIVQLTERLRKYEQGASDPTAVRAPHPSQAQAHSRVHL